MDLDTEPVMLSLALREQTLALHKKAEKSGIVADILRGRATSQGYVLFLRNLAPAYRQLEAGLDRHRLTPGVRDFARREVYRSSALEMDLVALSGPDWREALSPAFEASQHYARRIEEAAAGSGAGLIGHAYVRYLGDLSGGQVMKRLLARALGLGPQALSFYEFPGIDDLTTYGRSFRAALDQAPLAPRDRDTVISAAIEAFSMNIELSEAVRRAAPEAMV